VRDVEDLLTLYGVVDDDERAAIVELAERSGTPEWWTNYGDLLPDWFATYIGLETSADLIRGFQFQFVPGLFQTEDYARAVTRLGHQAAPPAEIERRVELRLRRQELLTRPSPPQIWMILDELVLRRPYGSDSAVMRAQLERLAEVARLPHVTLQAVPFSRGGHAGASGSFSVLRFQQRDLPDVVYIEQRTSAVYLDRQQDVQHYREIADLLSSEALTPAATVDFIAKIARET
jgi:Arc/MetJ-type ribon-helix-helix transcriptional regulator